MIKMTPDELAKIAERVRESDHTKTTGII